MSAISRALLGASVALGCTVLAPDEDEIMGGSSGAQPSACSADRACAAGWECVKGACLFVGSDIGAGDAGWPEADASGRPDADAEAYAEADTDPSCAPGFAECDGVVGNGCEDLSSNPKHCGSCGQKCGGRPCIDGACAKTCAQLAESCQLDGDCCAGACADGTCRASAGQPCSAGAECMSGNCSNQQCACSTPLAGLCATDGDCCAGIPCQDGSCCLPQGTTSVLAQLCCSKTLVAGKCG